MHFLILEPDPLISADIQETLAAEFAGDEIFLTETVDGFAKLLVRLQQIRGVVLSAAKDELEECIKILKSVGHVVPVVAIHSDGPDEVVDDHGVTVLQRPFSSDGLIAAVRNAFSDQLPSQSEMPTQSGAPSVRASRPES